MKAVKIISSLLLVSAMFGASAAHAGFDLKKAAGLSGGDSGTTANAADVVKNTKKSLALLTTAEVDILEALKGKEAVAASKELLQNTLNGDPTGGSSKTEALVKVDSSVGPQIEETMKNNAALNAEQKKKLLVAGVEYVKGVRASKDLLASIQSLAKNPAALGADASEILSAAKSLPAIVTKSVTTSANLTKFLTDQGVPKKDTSDLGV